MEERNSELIIGRLNDLRWFGNLSEYLMKYAAKLDIKNMPHQALYTYLYDSARRCWEQEMKGTKPLEELWLVYEEIENQPIKVYAFAHWFFCPLPKLGTVFIDHIFSWNTSKEPAEMLIDKFLEFGKNHGCIWYEWSAINERVCKVFEGIANKKGYDVKRGTSIKCVGRRK